MCSKDPEIKKPPQLSGVLSVLRLYSGLTLSSSALSSLPKGLSKGQVFRVVPDRNLRFLDQYLGITPPFLREIISRRKNNFPLPVLL